MRLAIVAGGASRDEAYRLVQRNAMKTWEQGKDFLTELKADKDVVARIKPADLDQMFDMGYHTKHVDTVFQRVFGEARPARPPSIRSSMQTPAS